ncbi:DUF6476 family protein [Palleronia salina]|uniref:DUF6476 family protein n=1 Tax=Palleronia salina TaxID=313368 RepID=UPI0009322535|nr:DUF6476 family protein [Palleronia salina]
MEQAPEPRDGALTVLKWLVIALTATMLVGMMALVWLFFTRFPAPGPALPDQIALPDGARATAFTRGSGWLAVVTGDNEILIFSPDGETLRQRIRIDQP